METLPISIKIDLSIYEAQLRGEIASDLTSLQLAYEGISSPEYSSRKFVLKQGITISEISVPPMDFQKRREINKCFKSIISSLQDYMDKLIALLKLKSENITIESLQSTDQIDKFIRDKFDSLLLQVSTDRSLNVPKKLDTLLYKIEHQVYKDAIQSYFHLRNGIEHHKGIAKVDRVIHYIRLGLASTAGYEIEKSGPLGENEGLVLRTFNEEITYDKGGHLIITKDQLDSIILTLLIFVIPAIQSSVAEKFGN